MSAETAAAAAERPELVRLDRAEDDEHTALHYAVLNRDAACTRFLLDAGADLTRRDPLLRSTPLGWACRWGRYELARLLIERGAAADEPDAAPLAWAARMGHDRLAALLRRHGAQRSG